MKWTCKKAQRYLDEYLNKELSAQEAFDYEAHLAACDGCRDFVETMAELLPDLPQLIHRDRPLPGEIQVPQKLIDLFEDLPIEQKRRIEEFVREAQAAEEEALRERQRRLKSRERRRREARRLPN